MTREDYDDPLYKESIPVRCSPPDGPLDGPTAAWMRAHPANVSTLPVPSRTQPVDVSERAVTA